MEYGYKPEENTQKYITCLFLEEGGNLLLNHEKLAEQYIEKTWMSALNVTVLTGHWFGGIKSVTGEGEKQKIHVITVKRQKWKLYG